MNMQQQEEAEVEGPNELGPHDLSKPIPAGYVLCEDGKLYRKRTVSGVMVAAITSGLGSPKDTARAERIEQAMGMAIVQAVSSGAAAIGSPELTAIILAARDKAIEEEG